MGQVVSTKLVGEFRSPLLNLPPVYFPFHWSTMHFPIRQVPKVQIPRVHSFHVQVYKTPYSQYKPNFIYMYTHTYTEYIYNTFYSLSFKPTAISTTVNMPMHDNMCYHSPRLRFAFTLKAEVQLISAHFFSKISPHWSSSVTALLGVLLWACYQGSEANPVDGILWPFCLNFSISAASIFIHLGW